MVVILMALHGQNQDQIFTGVQHHDGPAGMSIGVQLGQTRDQNLPETDQPTPISK